MKSKTFGLPQINGIAKQALLAKAQKTGKSIATTLEGLILLATDDTLNEIRTNNTFARRGRRGRKAGVKTAKVRPPFEGLGEALEDAPAPKKRGRPFGSKNKATLAKVSTGREAYTKGKQDNQKIAQALQLLSEALLSV